MRTVEKHEITVVSGSESGAGYDIPGTYTLDPGNVSSDFGDTISGFVDGFVKGFTGNL